MGTIAEANGRSTLYLGTLSSAVIAITFVGQANQLGDTFYLFAPPLLPPVFLLGVFSYLRLVQTSIEDLVNAGHVPTRVPELLDSALTTRFVKLSASGS